MVIKVTAQDISTMMRCGQRTIIFLINNGGYTIEVEIHDGPYNVIKNWNYTALVDAIHNGEGKCWTAKVAFIEIDLIFSCEIHILTRVCWLMGFYICIWAGEDRRGAQGSNTDCK